jgi:hypothetical protein
MDGDPKTWRTRLKTLRSKTEQPWSNEDSTVICADLLALLVEACPDVFEAPLIRYGSRTYRVFRLTADAAEDLSVALAEAAVASPRWGMMLTKPRPWRYQEST